MPILAKMESFNLEVLQRFFSIPKQSKTFTRLTIFKKIGKKYISSPNFQTFVYLNIFISSLLYLYLYIYNNSLGQTIFKYS